MKSIEDWYGEMEMPEMGEGEMEPMPEPPSEGMDPATFADESFSQELRFEVLHEAIEAYYEALCAGIDGVAMMPAGERSAFVVALLDTFASRLGDMVGQMQLDTKSLQRVSPDTLRGVERRLRDAIGLSRSDAKRLAPEIWTLLRDAGQTTDPEPIAEAEVKASPDSERDDILARLGLLMELK